MSRAALSLVILLQIVAVVSVGTLLTLRHEKGGRGISFLPDPSQLPATPALASLPAPPRRESPAVLAREPLPAFLPRLEVDERALTALPLVR